MSDVGGGSPTHSGGLDAPAVTWIYLDLRSMQWSTDSVDSVVT